MKLFKFVIILLSICSPRVLADEPSAYNPIEENGEYFVGWTTPNAAIIFTGDMNGYVEPCGCAGLDRMKGGLSRRHTFIKERESQGWQMIPIDGGNLVQGYGLQEEHKFGFVTDEALRLMKYSAVGLGERELMFPTDSLLLYTVDTPGNAKRFLSTNIGIYEFDPVYVAPYRTVSRGKVKVGITSVICKSLLGNVHNSEIVTGGAVEKLREVLPVLDEEKCNYTVLILRGTAAEAEAIVKQFPKRFTFVLMSDSPAEPPREVRRFSDGTYRIEVGEKGKFAVVFGLYDDKAAEGESRDAKTETVRYQRVALDSRYKNSPEIIKAMEMYQDKLKSIGLEGLGIRPVADQLAKTHGKYVGTKACTDCHEASFNVWKKSRHALAWASLKEKSEPPREFDPECITCHVVGWNPQTILPYESGFLSEKETPHLTGVGCESCHGPGELHAKAESGGDKELQKKLRQLLHVDTNKVQEQCLMCHDGDNSPDFDFKKYWEKIEHKESE
ncbi:MAG: hypothetical protein LBU65_03930 [Planctomycetaceae bacterium]|nr:hypothetical protein [Planctomycetaceae bacterium]